MTQARLDSGSARCRFTIGRNGAGRWIVKDARGLVGGIFVDRAAAQHFAMEECNYDPSEIDTAPEGVQLTLDDMLEAADGKRAAR